MCYIAAGQYLYYHVSPKPLGKRSCCLHIYYIFVYSCPDCILSPKLAHVSLFSVWVVDCGVAVPVTYLLKSLLLSERIQFKGPEITSFFSLTFVQNRVQSQNTKPQMFFKKVWTTVVNFLSQTWLLFTCSAAKEWVWGHAPTFHHAARLLDVP